MIDTWKTREVDMQRRIAELEKQLGEYAAAEANDPKTWPTVLKQMKRIAELESENERLTTLNERNGPLILEINRLTKALEQITRLSPRSMAVSEAQHIAGKALEGRKQ